MKRRRHLPGPPQLGTERHVVSADLVTPVRARHAGKLYARALRRYASPGMAIAKVAGTTPFRRGNLLSP